VLRLRTINQSSDDVNIGAEVSWLGSNLPTGGMYVKRHGVPGSDRLTRILEPKSFVKWATLGQGWFT